MLWIMKSPAGVFPQVVVLLQRARDVTGKTPEDQHDEHEQAEQAVLSGHVSARARAAREDTLGEGPGQTHV